MEEFEYHGNTVAGITREAEVAVAAGPHSIQGAPRPTNRLFGALEMEQ